jgi:hypothetical protein
MVDTCEAATFHCGRKKILLVTPKLSDTAPAHRLSVLALGFSIQLFLCVACSYDEVHAHGSHVVAYRVPAAVKSLSSSEHTFGAEWRWPSIGTVELLTSRMPPKCNSLHGWPKPLKSHRRAWGPTIFYSERPAGARKQFETEIATMGAISFAPTGIRTRFGRSAARTLS